MPTNSRVAWFPILRRELPMHKHFTASPGTCKSRKQLGTNRLFQHDSRSLGQKQRHGDPCSWREQCSRVPNGGARYVAHGTATVQERVQLSLPTATSCERPIPSKNSSWVLTNRAQINGPRQTIPASEGGGCPHRIPQSTPYRHSILARAMPVGRAFRGTLY